MRKLISKVIVGLMVFNVIFLVDGGGFINAWADPVINNLNVTTTDTQVNASGSADGNGANLTDKPYRYTVGQTESQWLGGNAPITINEDLTTGILTNVDVADSKLKLTGNTTGLPGYSYAKKITIDQTKIDQDLTNFPLTVYLNSSNFDFTKVKADGSDIRFTDANNNLLKFEKEEYSNSTSKATFNVLIPSVSGTIDTEIYMWYGNANAYNTSIEAWQDQTGKQLTYNGNVKILKGDGSIQRLYTDGTENISWSKGYSIGAGTKTYSEQTTNLFLYSANALVDSTTELPIDITGYDTVCVDWETTTEQNATGHAQLLVKPTRLGDYDAVAVADITGAFNRKVSVVDVSNLTGNYYITCRAQGGNTSLDKSAIKVHSVWLENRKGASFDGSGDYLSIPSSTDFNFGNGDFTIEFSVTPMADTNLNGNSWCADLMYGRGYTSAYAPTWNIAMSNKYSNICFAWNNYTETISSIEPVTLGTRYDIAVTRSGNTIYLFVNGVLKETKATTYTFVENTNGLRLNYAQDGDGSNFGTFYFNNYVHGLRITNGSARYTSNFTPPTSFSNDSSKVVFCTNFDSIYDNNYAMVQHMGDTLVDATGNGNNGTATGTTVVSTDYGKARSFNGTSDKITVPNSSTVDITGSNLSMMALVYPKVNNVYMTPIHKDYQYSLELYDNNKFTYADSSNFSYSDFGYYGAYSLNQWYNLAATKDSSNVVKIFSNTNIVASKTFGSAMTSTGNPLYIGSYAGVSGFFNGYIGETRISNIARADSWIKAESLALKNSLVTISDLQRLNPTGNRISNIYDISGAVSSSKIEWIEEKPAGTSAFVETNVSLDGGTTWLGWKSCVSCGAIPDLSASTQNAKLKIRETLNTLNAAVTPSISNVKMKIGYDGSYSQAGLTPNTSYTVKFEVKDINNAIAYTTKDVYTKAKTPEFSISETTYSAVTLSFADTNPAGTKYQIKCGSKYVDSTGTLSSVQSWITRPSNTIKITGLQSGTSYSFQAKARNNELAETDYSLLVSAKTSSILLPVNNAAISYTTSNDTVTVTWGAIETAASYEIEADGKVENVGKSMIYIHKGLLADTQHTYRVRAKNTGGYSGWSNLLVMKTTNNAPSAVTQLSAEASNDSVTIYWDKAKDAVSYTVQINATTIAGIKTNSASYFGLNPQTTYTYKVKSVNSAGESSWSAQGSVTTYLLKTPEISSMKEDTNEIKLQWNKVKDAASYEINHDGQITQITDQNDLVSYIHQNLLPLETHIYKVRAINASGQSAWSKAITLETLPERLSAPQNFIGWATENFINLVWNSVLGAIGYDIEIDGVVVENDGETFYKHTDISPYTEYKYRVRSVTDEIESLWSSLITVKTTGGIPTEPKNMEIVNSRGIATLSWDKTLGADCYDVEVNGVVKENIASNTFTHRKIPLIENGVTIYEESLYRIRSANTLGKSDWTGYFINNVIKGKAEKNKELDLGLTASNITDFSKFVLNVTYNPDVLTVTDLCAYSTEKELLPGKVEGHDIEIVSFEPGHIVFKVDKIVDEGYMWTGIINNIKFSGNITGGTTLTYTVDCAKDAF